MKKAIVMFSAAVVLGCGLFYAFKPEPIVSMSAEEYRSMISIEGLYAGRGSVGETTGMPVVWFKVRNNGNQTVERIQVHVEFLDEYGDVVFDKFLHPVHQGRESGEPVKPLEPGEQWQMSAIRYYIITGVPSSWKVGEVRADVSEVVFET